MKNKGSFYLICVIALSLILVTEGISAVCGIIGCIRRSDTSEPLSVSADTSSVVSDERTLLYLFGEQGGRLTVFAPDGETVVEQLDTWLWSLPIAERETISQKIPVYSVEELISLIEDYTS